MHADDRIRRDAERLQSFEIRRHVGLADQHVAHADLLQMIADSGLADRSGQPFQCEPCERM